MLRRLLAPALLLALCACASDDEPRHGGPGGHDGPHGGDHAGGPPSGPPRVRLFISPSGEPFRGEGGLARWFAQVDTDHDGSITLEEFRTDARHSFGVLDANHDGIIDGFELQAYERDIVPEIGVMAFDEAGAGIRLDRPRRGGGGGGMGGGQSRGGGGGRRSVADDPEQALRDQMTRAPTAAGRDGAARFSLLNEPQPISAADADVDGKVTLAEWMAQTDRRFAKLDKLKTGKLTLESLLQAQPKDQKGPPKPKG